MPAKPMMWAPSVTPLDRARFVAGVRQPHQNSILAGLRLQQEADIAQRRADREAQEAKELSIHRAKLFDLQERGVAIGEKESEQTLGERKRGELGNLLKTLYDRTPPEERKKLSPLFNELAMQTGVKGGFVDEMEVGGETDEEKRKKAIEGRERKAAEQTEERTAEEHEWNRELWELKKREAKAALENDEIDSDLLTTWLENYAEWDRQVDEDRYLEYITEDQAREKKLQNPWFDLVQRGRESFFGKKKASSNVPPELPAGTVYVGKNASGKDVYRLPDGRKIQK